MLPLTVNQCAEQSPTVVVADAGRVGGGRAVELARLAVRRVGREARHAAGVVRRAGRLSSASRMPASEAMTNRPALAQLVLLVSLVISSTSPAGLVAERLRHVVRVVHERAVAVAGDRPPPYGIGSYGVA